MTGAEPPLTVAAWSTAVGALVIGAVTPDGVATLLLAIVGILIGTVTRITINAARGRPKTKWWIELGIAPIEILITMVLWRGMSMSGISALAAAVPISAVGVPLIEQWIGANRPQLPLSVPMPPADPISPRNATGERRDLTPEESPIGFFGARITPPSVRPGKRDQDQDIVDKLGDRE